MSRRVIAIGLLLTALLLLIFVRPLREAEIRFLARVLPGGAEAVGANLEWPKFTITLTVLQSVSAMMIPWVALSGTVLLSLRLPVVRVLATLGVLLFVNGVLTVGVIAATAWVLSFWPTERASLLSQAITPGLTQLIMVVAVAVGIRLVYGPVPLPGEQN
ncbi:hypothetical protein [Actinocorallia longicatena]|uniref:Uncharacterized protein n=1 Tax=Actinocorallia longicatena TaxID=111803 RepID=A0ABP6QDW0_9ACTN